MNLIPQIAGYDSTTRLSNRLVSWRFIELEFIALTIIEGRDMSPLMFRDSCWKLDAAALEILNCVLQGTLQVKGYHRSAACLGAFRLPTVEPDVKPVCIDLGPRSVSLEETET